MIICRGRLSQLLRFGRKSSGGWSEEESCVCDQECFMPDDNDIDLIMRAIEFYNAHNDMAKLPATDHAAR